MFMNKITDEQFMNTVVHVFMNNSLTGMVHEQMHEL